MVKILVAGAGKSSPWLIKYLLDNAAPNAWQITVADGNAALIKARTGNSLRAKAAVFDITSDSERGKLVADADIVLSLMPPNLHILLAKDCLQARKHLITSSYISSEMRDMHGHFVQAGTMAMCEMGLDPGIDHMSAHAIIHKVRDEGGKLMSFSSYCGGLIAPSSDDNPWRYKFSWNPRNIIDAGKAGALYLDNGVEVLRSYEKIFQNNPVVNINGLGDLAWYPNRDSISYLKSYCVPDAHTFLRATLRYPEFCAGWNALRAIGATDWECAPEATVQTFAQWTTGLIGNGSAGESAIVAVEKVLGLATDSPVMAQLAWLGLFEDRSLPADRSSNAQILLQLLEEKWAMSDADRDMVVMQHEVGYETGNVSKTLTSSMVLEGETRDLTAMAKTVGLPMGLLAAGILNKRIAPLPGVHIPDMREVYEPVLSGLVDFGIRFKDSIS